MIKANFALRNSMLGVFCFLGGHSFAQTTSFSKQFETYFQLADSLNQRLTLEKWRSFNDKDPEFITAEFNYLISQSTSERLVLGDDPESQEFIEMMSADSTLKGNPQYIFSETVYDTTMLTKAFISISRGIFLYPNRLDMRFGKIYMIFKMKNLEYFTKEIIQTLDYGQSINNRWKWTNNDAVVDSTKFLLMGIQEYVQQLNESEDPQNSKYQRLISESVLKYYPDDVVFLTNLAVTYINENNSDKGLEYLLKAEKINTKDPIVLFNIAVVYDSIKKEKKKAKAYYKEAIKYGDEDMKRSAKEQIELLKSSK